MMLLPEEGQREGYMLVKEWARELYRRKRFSVVVGNPGMIWVFSLMISLLLEGIGYRSEHGSCFLLLSSGD